VDTTGWTLVSVVIMLVMVALLTLYVFFSHKGPSRGPDYYSLFIMGLLWLALGFPLDSAVLSLVGAVLMLIAWMHRDRWEANRRALADMTSQQWRARAIIIGAGLLALLAALIVAFTRR
jgi:integral membrane sensor domain MASE1